jgi:large subunit ribosomal protein L1
LVKEEEQTNSESVSKLNTSLDYVTKAISTVKGQTKRNFVQTVEAGVNLMGINFKQTANRIGFDAVLPHAFQKAPKVALFGTTPNFINSVSSAFDRVITGDQIPTFDKKSGKKLAKEFDLFFAEPASLTLVGKYLGQTLAPRGKMPKPCPPDMNAIKALINNASKTVTISNKKGDGLPVLHFPIGKESMTEKEIAENFLAVYNKLLPLLPAGTQNLKSMYIKTTMGPIKYIFKR